MEENIDDEDDRSYSGEVTDSAHDDDGELRSCAKHSEDILRFREENGMICRQYPVKETHKVIRSEVNIKELRNSSWLHSWEYAVVS